MKTRYDVMVLGGGTAGCAAAIAAAERGCEVLLVEESNALGGCSTTGLVNEWFAHTSGLGSVFDSVYREIQRAGLYYEGRIFNGEHLKWIWQVLCRRAGVDILFHGTLAGVKKTGRRIQSVDVVACSRHYEFSASYFVDATGEGDLGALSGAEYRKGNPESGRQLHMSLMFQMVKASCAVVPYLPEGVEPYASWDEVPGVGVHVLLDDGRVYCNITKITSRDSTDPFDLTAAELEAREQMMKVVYLLQTTTYKDYIPVASGARIGIREGRRLVGDYVLTADDIIDGCSFEDGTVVATSQIDFHSLTKKGTAGWRKEVKPYGIPFRCLYSKDLDNLLMAGKCASTDQIVHSSSRMTPTCCGMGETAGIAASMAVQGKWADIRDVPVDDLRRKLGAAGFELRPEKHAPFHIGGFDGSPEERL